MVARKRTYAVFRNLVCRLLLMGCIAFVAPQVLVGQSGIDSLQIQKADSFAANGNFDSAFFQLKKHITTEEKVVSQQAIEDSKRVHIVLEKKLADEQSSNRTYILLISGILLLLIMVVIFMTYIWKSSKKIKIQSETINQKNKTIKLQYDEILQQNEEITGQNEMLSSYKNDLEQRVAEKTQHLEQALNKAEESDRLKTAFLTNLSHEIRTPMNAIVGFSNLLNDNYLDEKSRSKYTDVIIKSTDQLNRIINDIVAISKIESGEIKINRTYFDINLLFQELSLLFGKQLYEYNKNHLKLDFFNQLNEDHTNIVADRKIIKQVLINLIDNSVKYTNEGSITFGCKHNGTGHIQFYVKDTGIGIDEKDFITVFQRFRQIESKEQKKNKGVGLGLAISKGLVQKMGGDLEIESEKGKGSTFHFTIQVDFV